MDNQDGTTAADKTLLVLEAAISQRKFSAIVTETALPKSTVHRLLQTLISHGFLRFDESIGYLPGSRALALAGHALEQIDMSSLAAPVLEGLSASTGCAVHVGALSGAEIVYVARRDSGRPYRMPSRIGQSLRLHSSAMGKAVLAGMDDDRLSLVLDRLPFTPLTPRTLTVREDFEREIAKVRKDGFAVDDEENLPGIRCLGVGVRDHTGQLVFAISLSTLTLEHDLESLRALAPLVVAAAAELSTALGAPSRGAS